MKHARPLLLAVSTLALLISACSQPLDSQSKTAELAPQFGTQESEYVAHVAVNTEGIYLGGSWEGEPALIKYTRAGRLPWVKFPQPAQGEWAHWEGGDGGIKDVELSADGHIHVLQRAYGQDFLGTYYLSKYAPDGSLLWKRRTVTTNYGAALGLSLDGQGNHYVLTAGNDRGSFLYKHNAKGALLWRKPLPRMLPYATQFVATPAGSVYVARQPVPYDSLYRGRLTKYDSAGRQVWERTLPFENEQLSLGKNGAVYVAGTGFTYVDSEDYDYMPSSIKLARYTSSGGVSWTKTVADWTATATVAQGRTFELSGLATDAQDGAYVGLQKVDKTLDDPESLTLRKYGATGTRVWTRTFELRNRAELRDLAVASPSEIYLTGDLPQVGTHHAYGRDGFLMRLNGQGERVWMR
jgi:hypothetical protein